MGALFIPNGKQQTHSYKDWGVYMAPPTYDLGTEKTLLVYLPYRNEPLDFSNINNNNRYFDESKFTYEFFGKAATGLEAMNKVTSIKSYFRDFRGNVTDDALDKNYLANARCTGFNFDINPRNGFYSLSVELTGIYK